MAKTRLAAHKHLFAQSRMPSMSLPPLARLTVTRVQARRAASLAIAVTAGLEVLSGAVCGHRDAESQAIGLLFLLVPLSPALVALFTPNPLSSVAAAVPVAGWIVYAFYFECIRPYRGGGASMVYLGVWFYGFMSAVAAALVSIPLMRHLGVRVGAA